VHYQGIACSQLVLRSKRLEDDTARAVLRFDPQLDRLDFPSLTLRVSPTGADLTISRGDGRLSGGVAPNSWRNRRLGFEPQFPQDLIEFIEAYVAKVIDYIEADAPTASREVT
jgi:hypothetical protein